MPRLSNPKLAWLIAALPLTSGGCICDIAAEYAKRHSADNMTPSMADVRQRTIQDITPSDAKEMLAAGDSEYVYVDVRTVREFVDGHVPESYNVPVLQINPSTGERAMNGRFLAVVQGLVPLDAPVIVGCRSGKRSGLATKLLLEAGYENLYNVIGGFIGGPGMDGTERQPGWSKLDYPIEYGDGDTRSYEALSANIQNLRTDQQRRE